MSLKALLIACHTILLKREREREKTTKSEREKE